ncbi:MAG: hypothetical protein SFX73_04385 [Kofleriaceae bacterium]|nr:hypothetical protein [Kofleriaceae bacterium]
MGLSGRLFVLVMVAGSVAHGQPVAEPPVSEPDPLPALAPPVPQALPASDPAWEAYDRAFTELGAGNEEAARGQLRALTATWPQHRAASLGALRLMDLDTAEQRRLEREATGPSKLARGELVFWSTAGGVLLARDLCVNNCTSDREYAAAYTFSIGGSLALSVLASRNGIHRGEAQLYNSAQTWGSWNALAINDGFAEDEQEAAISIGAQLGGLAAGIGLWQAWRPTQGDVALANTGFVWTTVMTLFGHLAVDAEPTLRTAVVAGDIGILAGALLSTQVKMSRGRTLLIDLGGVLGIMGGGLIAIGSDSEEAAGSALLIGTGAGLGIAAYATRHWDLEPPPGNARVVPTRAADGNGWGLAVAFDN